MPILMKLRGMTREESRRINKSNKKLKNHNSLCQKKKKKIITIIKKKRDNKDFHLYRCIFNVHVLRGRWVHETTNLCTFIFFVYVLMKVYHSLARGGGVSFAGIQQWLVIIMIHSRMKIEGYCDVVICARVVRRSRCIKTNSTINNFTIRILNASICVRIGISLRCPLHGPNSSSS